MKKINKILAIALAIVTLSLAVVVGTLAYLISTPQAITNTFTVGEGVSITLEETKPADFKAEYLPGKVIEKDPTITVEGRECWVFVQIKTTENIADFIDYVADEGWTETVVASATAGGYTTVTLGRRAAAAKGDELSIISNNTVTCKSTVTAMPAADLTMTFTAYVIQTMDGVTTAAAAWTALNNQLNSTVGA